MMGDITAGSVEPDNSNADSVTRLAINWEQDKPETLVSASYKLYRWPTGATDKGNNLCGAMDGQVDETLMNTLNYATPGDATTPLRIQNVPLCTKNGGTLAKGRCAARRSC